MAQGIYILDKSNTQIRKVTPDGKISTLVFKGLGSFADFSGLAADNGGNLFISDFRNLVVYKATPDGTATRIAGGGSFAGGAEGGTTMFPGALAVDATGDVYVVDYDTYRIREIMPSGAVVNIAGNAGYGFSGDGGKATSAAIYPSGVALDSAGKHFHLGLRQQPASQSGRGHRNHQHCGRQRRRHFRGRRRTGRQGWPVGGKRGC